MEICYQVISVTLVSLKRAKQIKEEDLRIFLFLEMVYWAGLAPSILLIKLESSIPTVLIAQRNFNVPFITCYPSIALVVIYRYLSSLRYFYQ